VNRFIEFSLDATGKTTVLVETDDTVPAQGLGRVSIGGVVAEGATEAFDTVLAQIRPIASSVMREVTNAGPEADEIEVEFGIKLTAAAGVALARAAGEGHCKISLKWARKSSSPV
jgi:hypothetical protein